MFASVGLLLLIIVDYLRPQEYLPALYAVPLLHVATALALLGLVLDLRLGLSRLRPAPHLVPAVLLFLWCLVGLAIRAPEELGVRAAALAVPLAIYLILAHGIQTFRMLAVVCGLLLAIGLALSAIGIEQGLSDYGCHRVSVRDGNEIYLYDGRPCSEKDRNVCEGEGAAPGADYWCEKVGLFGTQSVHGRVRYRGTLEDPNELALAVGIVIPFALAFLDRRRTVGRSLAVAAAFGLVGLCIYFTQSRGGQLLYLAVLAVYFVRRFGARLGLLTGVLAATPILIFGGRSGAEDSTMERTVCWWTGLHLFQASPGFGVGYGQFLEHHGQTAHNSFILVAAELGLPGLLLWTAIVYIAVKIPLAALRADLPPVAKSWALALLASMAGLLTGSLFLSFAYKDVFWIFIGLTGVLYQAIQRHDHGFRVDFGLRDLGILALVDGALLIALVGYTALKLGW
jgi:hypothetical protein